MVMDTMDQTTPWAKLREEHYVRHFGPVNEPTFRPAEGGGLRPLVYRFRPHGERKHWTLITSGMSDQVQPLPAGSPAYLSPRTELLMYVSQSRKWMFEILTGLSELPFRDSMILHWWYALPNGMPMTPQPSLLTNFLFLPPFCESVDFDELEIGTQRVQTLFLVPITDAEMEFISNHGAHALVKVFEENGFDGVVDEERASLV